MNLLHVNWISLNLWRQKLQQLVQNQNFRGQLVFNFLFSVFSCLTESAESFWGTPHVWRGCLSIGYKPSLCSFLGANNSRACRARHPDRQWEGKCFTLNKGECRSSVLNLHLSFCEDGWCGSLSVYNPRSTITSVRKHISGTPSHQTFVTSFSIYKTHLFELAYSEWLLSMWSQ